MGAQQSRATVIALGAAGAAAAGLATYLLLERFVAAPTRRTPGAAAGDAADGDAAEHGADGGGAYVALHGLRVRRALVDAFRAIAPGTVTACAS